MKSGKHCDMTAGPRGQQVVRQFGRDDSSHKVNDGEAKNGRKMGGSTENLGHSLTGGSAVQHVKGRKSGDM
jgi:hypothetical protein